MRIQTGDRWLMGHHSKIVWSSGPWWTKARGRPVVRWYLDEIVAIAGIATDTGKLKYLEDGFTQTDGAHTDQLSN